MDGSLHPGSGTDTATGEASASSVPAIPRAMTVLHVGCGPRRADKLHPWFRGPGWRELRLDIDPAVRPDVVASVVDLAGIEDGAMDAVWTSHTLEHLADHEVLPALREMVRVLKPDGFSLVTTPDIVRVAREVARGRLEEVLYEAPAGPITALDVLFGLRSSVARGRSFMAHRTGFSAERLGRLMAEAGFAEARSWEGDAYDLWAVGLMPAADLAARGLTLPG